MDSDTMTAERKNMGLNTGEKIRTQGREKKHAPNEEPTKCMHTKKHANGMCNACYKRDRYNKKVKEVTCIHLATLYAKGKCRVCYD